MNILLESTKLTIKVVIILFILILINQSFQICEYFYINESWSYFGTYLYGFFGTVLSFATVVILVVTYHYQRNTIEKQRFDSEFNLKMSMLDKTINSISDREHLHFWRDMKFIDMFHGIAKYKTEYDSGSLYEASNLSLHNGKMLHELIVIQYEDYKQNPDIEKYINDMEEYWNHACLINLGTGRLFLKTLYNLLKGGYHAYVDFNIFQDTGTELRELSMREKFSWNMRNHLHNYRPVIASYFWSIQDIVQLIATSENNKGKYFTTFLNYLSYSELMLIYYYAFYLKEENLGEEFFNLLKTEGIAERIIEMVEDKDFLRNEDKQFYV